MGHGIDGLGIRGQQQRLGIQQAFPDHDLLWRHGAERPHALAPRGLAHPHDLREIDLGRPVERLQIAQALRGVVGGIAVLELELADASLQRFGVQSTVWLRSVLLTHDFYPFQTSVNLFSAG